MGLQDRAYAQEREPRGGLGSVSALSANTWIIIANVAIHVFRGITARPNSADYLYLYGFFSTNKVMYHPKANPAGGGLEFWRFLTFQFLHAPGLMHVGMNMLGLYIFGSLVEQHLGRKRYVAFYLTCGIFGALMYLLLNVLGVAFNAMSIKVPGFLAIDVNTPLVGASAGVFGIIMACAYLSPNEMVQLMFPPITMRMKVMAYGYLALAVLNLIFGGTNAGGDAAHVGGAIAGYFFIRNSHLLRDFFDVLNDSRQPKNRPRGGPRLRLVGEEMAAQGPSEEEINRVLDKLRTSGRESLSVSEQETLRSATAAKRAVDRS